MKSHIASIITLATLIFYSCSNSSTTESETKKAPADWKDVTQENYTIKYPPTWEFNQRGEMGTTFIFFSPLESPDDKFRENVNLIVQDLSGYTMDLNKYAEISEGQVKTMIPNSVLLLNERMKDGATEYHKMIYTGDQANLHLKFEQYYWVLDEKAYVLTLTSEQEKFDAFKETGETILNSFAFTK